ncbi:MAG: hypothetical protein A2148_09635 [Chloroflexi bacterium RBG_16_68_14]|nr:MAG: hypothetical protein A2148_09635 [Chloroflexi bacterium RBG_16_68_14]
MTSAETRYSFDLAEEMAQQLEQEFGPEALRGELQKAFGGGGASPKGAQADSFFTDFGRRWMQRTIELGEQYTDRTYETLKDAAKKVETLSFPFISQRFIEIAYLSTQPVYSLPIVENSGRGLTFRMPFCGHFKAIREGMGEEFADQLHCKNACLAACQTAFEHFGFSVAVAMDAAVPKDEYCQFSIRRA